MDLDGYDRENLPLVAGEVVGWRAWVVTVRREPRLRSLFHEVLWPTDRYLEAEVRHDYATEKHGICAARDRDHLLTMHRYMDGRYPRYVEGEDTLIAIGEVALAGLIVPGARGYRAERARPVSIVLPHIAWELVEPLRRAYRVPVTLGNVLVNPGGQHGHRA